MDGRKGGKKRGEGGGGDGGSEGGEWRSIMRGREASFDRG